MSTPANELRDEAAPSAHWRLVDLIYATAQDPDRWPALVAALARAVQGGDARHIETTEEQSLVLHLEQALATNSHISHQLLGLQSLESLLSSLAFPFLLIDDNYSVVYRSERFSDVLHCVQGIALDASGDQLVLSGEAVVLSEVIAGARDSLTLRLCESAADVAVARDVVVLSLPVADGTAITLIAWFEDSAFCRRACDDVASVYGLTTAEAELLASILADKTYPEIALAREVSQHTVHSQAKQIFGKTGCHSKSELAQLVLCGPALLNRYTGDKNQRYVKGAPDDARRTQVLTLDGDAQLGFAEFGPEDGTPILFIHNVSGSRLQIPVPESHFFEQGIRLIVPDRFGVGLSTWPQPFSLERWAATMDRLLDHLKLDRVHLIGTSVGAIYALACAQHHPQRFRGMALVSPMTELTQARHLACVHEDLRSLLRLAKRAPSILRLTTRLMTRGNPSRHLDRQILRLPVADQALFRDPGFYDMSLRALSENLRSGVNAMVHDFELLAHPLQLSLCEIGVPTRIWHGGNDATSPLLAVREMNDTLIDSALNVLPGETHMLLNRHWHTVVAHLLHTAGPA